MMDVQCACGEILFVTVEAGRPFATVPGHLCGQAGFPYTVDTYRPQDELTLRDRVAMAALTGMLAGPRDDSKDSLGIEQTAQACYILADAMLEARKAQAQDK